MNNDNENNADNGFLLQLHMRTQQKAQEIANLLHEQQRLEMSIERAKEYFEQLNNFLKAEGQEPVTIKTTPHKGTGFGKPGNRSKSYPIRKIQWEGMSINEIVLHILNASPDVSFHSTEIASLIYEVEADADLKMVMQNIRSTTQRGVRDGLWERAERGRFKAKVNEQQGALVNN